MSTASNPKKRFLYDDDDHRTSHHASSQGEAEDQIFVSAAVHDRLSTFTAHFHPARSTFHASGTQKPAPSQSMTAIVKRCQAHPAFREADHRMVAWRKRTTQQTLRTSTSPSTTPSAGSAIYTLGSDDDGEKYAGKRLERVLAEMSVEGVVVVARWYGGVLLGPIRFTHIENCAKEAVQKWKDSGIGDEGEDAQPPAKRSKVGDGDGAGDEVEKAKLAEQLGRRDESITVLRDLLAGKTPAKEKLDSSQLSAPATASSPAKKVEYTEMPLARLRQLDKARDASIAFLLKQLDKVEEEGEEESERHGRGKTQA